jgi:hypothetical protein
MTTPNQFDLLFRERPDLDNPEIVEEAKKFFAGEFEEVYKQVAAKITPADKVNGTIVGRIAMQIVARKNRLWHPDFKAVEERIMQEMDV